MKKQPNILLIINDHQAYYRHGWDGGVRPETPNFDSMAMGGMRFESAYTPCALCVPARRSLFTGLFPHNHGLITNNEEIPEKDSDMFFRYLIEKGYKNYYFGKWHNGPMHLWDQGCRGFSLPGYGNPYSSEEYKNYCKKHEVPEAKCRVEHSFDPLVESGCEYMMRDIGTSPRANGVLLTGKESHEAFFLATLACEKLRQLEETEDPWCMVVSNWGPHRPFFPSSEYAKMYTPDAILPYGNFYDDLEEKPETYKHEHNDGIHDINGNIIIPNPLLWTEWQNDLAKCYAHITEVDAAGGLILDELARLKLDKDTLVIWTADHGDAVASHGGHATKGSFMSDELYRIPFAVRWPGEISSHKNSKCMISLVDIAPTLLDLVDAEFDRSTDGQSLLRILKGNTEGWRDSIFCEFNGLNEPENYARMIITERYAYVVTKDDIDELYDLYDDPYRLLNLAKREDMKILKETMKKKLIKWQYETQDNVCF